MAPLFQMKRIQVPGLLSDEGFAAGLKALQEARQTGDKAKLPPQSAVEFADKIAGEVAKSAGTIEVPKQKTPGAELAVSDSAPASGGINLFPGPGARDLLGGVATAISQAGTLDTEEGAAAKIERYEQAAADAIAASGEMADKTDVLTPDEREAIGLAPLTPADIERINATKQQEGEFLQEKVDYAKFLKDAPAPTQEEWLNIAQTATRSAAQMGVGTLRYPADIYDTLRAVAMGDDEVKKSDYTRWVDGVDKALTRMMPGDPARSKDFVTKLAAGAGSMTGFMITGWVGRTIGLPASLTVGTLGAAVEGDSVYQDANTFGATPTQKLIALFAGSGLGLTEAIPIDRMFMRADIASGGQLRNILANTTAGSLEEFIQEASQSIGEDIVAKYGAAYDPTREIDYAKAFENGVIGAITGGVAGGVAGALQGTTGTVDDVQMDDAKKTAIVDEVLNASQQRFDAILGADAAVDGEGEVAPPAQGESSSAAAGDQAAPAGPDPVRGDRVQEIAAPVQTVGADKAAQGSPADVFTPEFRQLFEGSTLVNADGTPMLLYRGTNEAQTNPLGAHKGGTFFASDPAYAASYARGSGAQVFSKENRARQLAKVAEGKKVRVNGVTTQLSQEGDGWHLEIEGFGRAGPYADKDTAMDYAERLTPRGMINGVVQAYVSAKKPFIVDWGGGGWNVGSKTDERAQGISTDDFVSQNRARLEAEGYDAIILKNVEGPGAYDSSVKVADEYVIFDAAQIFRAEDAIDQQVAADPIAQAIQNTVLEPTETLPLPNIEKGLTGPIEMVVKAARAYAAAAGIPLRRQREYVKVDTSRAARIAQAYADMPHQPEDPAVKAAYKAMAEETIAQYRFVLATGIKIESMKEGQPDPYEEGPRAVLKDIASGHIWYFPTKFGFGSDASFDPSTNPLLEETEFKNDAGETMLVNDLFRVVHDFFGHGMEGSGFGPRGEENAWQSHMRLFSESAIPAMTSETRGQNSWVNYGPHGEANRANPRETVYADQKTGIMPSWTWREGVEDSKAYSISSPVEGATPEAFVAAISAAKAASEYGAVVHVYTPAEYAKMRLFLAPDGNAGFALKGEDIVSVFGRGGGRLRGIMDTAIANGGRTLDAFDTGLPDMYRRYGFVETKREPWNEQHKPEGWPEKLGKPDVVYMEYVGNDIEQQSAVPLRRKIETLKPFGLDASGRSVNVRQVAAALELRQQKQAGKIDRKDYSTKASNRIAKWMAEEVAFEMAHPEQSGVGWYSERFQAALNTFSDVFPELADNKDARDMLTLFIAITSDGQKVVPNFAQAIDIYANYRRTGKLSTGRGHARQSSIDSNMAHIQQLLEVHKTPAALREYLLKEDTVANLRKDAKENASEFRTAYKADVMLPRAAVELGPKLGAFYANLMGSQGYLTMDRWWSRTFNRYRGDLIDTPTQAGLDRMRKLLDQPDLTDEQVIAATIPYRHSYEAKDFKDGTEIEKAANTLYKAAFENLNDRPFSASDRSFMIDTVKQAQKVLKKQGIDMTIADIQAVLWYYEKRLYGELGARQSADISYEEAAARVVADREAADAEKRDAIAYDARMSGYERSAYMSEDDVGVDFMTGTSTTRAPYLGEPTRPTAGVPFTSQNIAQPDVKLTKIGSNFVKLLNITARHGRLAARDSKVMGEYHRRSAVVRMRTWTDFSTLVHEAGHAINDSQSAVVDAFVQANRGDVSKLAHKYYAGDLSQAPITTVLREGFAEFFRIYVTNPQHAKRHFPQLTTAFETAMKAADPQLINGLQEITSQFQAWLKLPSQTLIENMVVDGRREQGINAAIKELRDQGFKTWMHEHARRSTSWLVNRYASLVDLEAQLLNLGQENQGRAVDLARSETPSVIMRLARNAGSRGMVQITDGVLGYRSTQSISRGLREGLMTALGIPPDTTPASLDEEVMKKFDAYLIARRSFDEFNRFDQGKIERPPIGAQKGDVIRAIQEYEKEFPNFIPAANIVHEYGMAMWQKRYDAGLMDKETYEEGKDRAFYVPLQRDVSDKQGNAGDSINFGSSALTKGPRFRGSDRDIISPMTVLMQMTFALEKQIAENDAKRALAVLADRAGQAGALVERIPGSQLIGQTFSVEQVGRRLIDDAQLSATDAADMLTLLSGSIDKGDMMTLFRSEQAGAQGENVVFFWENGKVAAIRLNDTEVAADVVNMFNSVGRENMDWPMELIAGTSSVFRTAITAWPDFLIVNYIRDQFSAWILNDVGYVPFVSGIGGMADEIRQKQWAKSYNAAGGIMGGASVAQLHTSRIDRDINSLRSTGYVANIFGEWKKGWHLSNATAAAKGFGRAMALTETGTRLGLYKGAYKRALKDGLNDYDASVEAAYIATDYIDFGLNGSKMLNTRRMIPFLNAQIQGLYKMVRTLGGDEVARRKGLRFALTAYFKNINNLPLSRSEKQQLNTGRKAWIKMVGIGLISAALHFLFRDDEDYQEAGEYLRTNGWVIPTGGGNVIWIPKPFELAMVANAMERALEFASGDPTAVDRFKRGIGMALTPPTMPPAIGSLLEVSTNMDFFTGRPIVPEYVQALEPELQYDNSTTNLAKWLGGATGQSPMVVDHILGGMGASAYRDITTMLNAADPTRPAPDANDLPILRRFVRDVRKGSVSAQDFWTMARNGADSLQRGADSYKRYIDVGNEIAANRYLSTLDADHQAYALLMTHFKAEQKKLNPVYRAQQVTKLVSAMSREIGSPLSLEDTTVKDFPDQIPMSAGKKRQVIEILSEIGRRTVRNTLISTGQPGWSDKEQLPLDETFDMLLAVSPETYDEYKRREAKAKIYDEQMVNELWPDVRDRLINDRELAVLDDAVAISKVVF